MKIEDLFDEQKINLVCKEMTEYAKQSPEIANREDASGFFKAEIFADPFLILWKLDYLKSENNVVNVYIEYTNSDMKKSYYKLDSENTTPEVLSAIKTSVEKFEEKSKQTASGELAQNYLKTIYPDANIKLKQIKNLLF